MLVGRKDGIIVMLSSIGLVRCYLTPRIGGTLVHQGQTAAAAATAMLSRQARSKVTTRSTNTIIGPDGAVDHGDDSNEPFLDNMEMWDTWEFGSWKVWAIYALATISFARDFMLTV